MKVKFARLNPFAKIPTYAKEGDAGLDLTAIQYEIKDKFVEYKFGLAVEIPVGYVGLLFPRSSLSNKDLILSNHVGVVDSGYRGELTARFKMPHNNAEIYTVGDRVVQLVVIPYPNVEAVEVKYEELSVTERGKGGFGSSGN